MIFGIFFQDEKDMESCIEDIRLQIITSMISELLSHHEKEISSHFGEFYQHEEILWCQKY
jgi:hypothetical protein